MARMRDETIALGITCMKNAWPERSDHLSVLLDLQACRSILSDFLARMADTYDGADGANNRMPFTGSDMAKLEELTR